MEFRVVTQTRRALNAAGPFFAGDCAKQRTGSMRLAAFISGRMVLNVVVARHSIAVC